MTDPTGASGHLAFTKISPRVVAFGGGALLALFLGLGLWALQDPPFDAPETSPPETRAPLSDAPEPPPPVPEQPSEVVEQQPEPHPVAPASANPVVIKPARELNKLLAQRFQFTRHDGAPAFAHLRSALGPERAVTVLNVWAPYCEPCKREFPAFRALQAGWGSDVRFMPIQLGEGEPGPLADIMPIAAHHLLDFVPGGAVQSTLAELGLLPTNAPIPITLVLDCRHQLRFLSAQEITDMQEFERLIGELRRELDTAACRPVAAPAGPQAIAHCGDGKCEPLGAGEDCLSCPADCGCKPGQLCATQAGARDKLGHVCMDELQ
ncbi:TlpA family protein disulfide reductase [Nannocystis punicea]|uniref:Thioredoxin domain-containing protein n=1 Tax=Nannocystis punicea TaxID=2995304 RepID=A0ABY7H392_9BACT|nr:hypothetical protein [Nannocystis poenicansa]WAS93587.1 hypothetical protein O0S08_46230 [Nannocystis poenicansa]